MNYYSNMILKLYKMIYFFHLYKYNIRHSDTGDIINILYINNMKDIESFVNEINKLFRYNNSFISFTNQETNIIKSYQPNRINIIYNKKLLNLNNLRYNKIIEIFNNGNDIYVYFY